MVYVHKINTAVPDGRFTSCELLEGMGIYAFFPAHAIVVVHPRQTHCFFIALVMRSNFFQGVSKLAFLPCEREMQRKIK
jgi:hypothetical protein